MKEKYGGENVLISCEPGMHAPPRPALTPGEMAAPGRPGPENFQECPAPPRPTPKMPRGLTVTPPSPEIFFLRPAPKQKKAAPHIPDLVKK